jgi:hypothetical protein
VSDKSKTPNSAKLEAVKFPTTRALLSTHTPELLPDPLEGGYTWDNANAPLFVGPFVSMVDADRALAKDIAALEEKHAIEIASLLANIGHTNNEMMLAKADVYSLTKSLAARDAIIATLRAKMAGMVCGTCFGRGLLETPNTLSPCPVCQPKKEG